MKAPEKDSRSYAVYTLGRYAQLIPGDIAELYDALSDPDPFVRRGVCDSLPHRTGARPAVPILARSLGDPAPVVRRAAAWRLKSIGLDAETALGDLHRAAEDEDQMVREAAAEAVRRVESEANDFRRKLLPGALEDLTSPGPAVRYGAAEMLGGFGPHSAPAVPAFIHGLDDRDVLVRIASVHAVGMIGSAARDALPAFATLEDDLDERVRQSSKAASSAIRRDAAWSK